MEYSDLHQGDEVELVEPATDLTWGGTVVPLGTRGTLGWRFRIQDGYEIWPMWLHQRIGLKYLLCVNQTQVKKVTP